MNKNTVLLCGDDEPLILRDVAYLEGYFCVDIQDKYDLFLSRLPGRAGGMRCISCYDIEHIGSANWSSMLSTVQDYFGVLVSI